MPKAVSLQKVHFLGEPSPTNFKSKHYIFSIWAVSSMTRVETEELIYPVFTLVAEFGGSLGLFMGFLFIYLWDIFRYIENVCAIFGAEK